MMNLEVTDKSYQRKIKTKEELRELLGSRPRKRSAIMCHGTFDIVHPGHIRHLMYCSEKADLLIASLTSDVHISKGQFRPFVPQDLRAMNLAALEVVDYVIIDPNPTPIEHLKYIQPDYFAKGYEYFKNGQVHPKTQEELDVIEAYGGEIIFTPGDVVYSSSHLIESEPPNIAADKLLMLMKAENITFNDLRRGLDNCSGQRVHVIGDTIVDSYSHTTMIGGGTKTPTLSVKLEECLNYSGGAAVVAKHLRKAGAHVEFSTVLGNDDLKDFVLKDLEEAGVVCNAIIDKTRPTTQKNVFICRNHRLLKVDKLDNRTVSERIVEQLKKRISETATDALVFSDFRHGIFSQTTIPQLVQAIPSGVFKVADSQVASRWGNILEFKGFDLITPNEREARFATGDQDSVIRPLALKLFEQAECRFLILKLGELGSITYRKSSHQDPRAFFTVDSFADRVVDPVGAGDALLAYATLALAATKNEVIASILGSMAAAVVCAHDGNNPVSPDEVHKIIDATESQAHYS
jgi:rfaE bifunctional protein kinase chain/domain